VGGRLWKGRLGQRPGTRRAGSRGRVIGPRPGAQAHRPPTGSGLSWAWSKSTGRSAPWVLNRPTRAAGSSSRQARPSRARIMPSASGAGSSARSMAAAVLTTPRA
jgi:hypothetical protein